MARTEAIAQSVIRVLMAVFTAVVLLLFQSAFWSNGVPSTMLVILIGTALVAYFRPVDGLLLVAAFTPLGRLISHLLGSQIRSAEALVLACLAGLLLRGWTLHRFRRFPSNRLHLAALLFGLVVAASCIEQLWLLQLRTDFPGAFLSELLDYASRRYLTSYRGFGLIYYAMLLLEGIALLVYAMHYCTMREDVAARLLRMVVAVTVGIAVLNVAFFANELMDTGEPGARFVEFLTRGRFSAHIGDVNAAGSFFAMAVFIAAGFAVRQRHHTLWTLGTVAILVAVWLTSSRTAIFSVVLIAMAAAAWMAIAQSRKTWRTGLLAVAALVALGLVVLRVLPQHFFDSTATRSGNIRWMFLATTARMLEAYPLFGLGIGQYSRFSGTFSSPELVAIYPNENAHNNFAQIAGELGMLGLAAFVWMLYIALRRPHDVEPNTGRRYAGPALVGVAAFLLTCLGGHPLLIPEVSYDFWLTVAVIPGLWHVRRERQSLSLALVAVCAVALAGSIGPRIYYKLRLVDWANTTYGLTNERFISSRARLFISSSGAYDVTLPFRARTASPETPVEIDVLVDGRRVETTRLTDRTWRSTRISLDPDKSSGFHRIDLHVRRSDPVRRTRGVELGERRIIPRPNG